MTAPVIADALGPRGRRQVIVASIVATIGVGAVLAVALSRLADKGQLDADRWEPFLQITVWRFLWEGLLVTLRLAAVSMALALTVGVVMALGRLARNAPVRWLAGVYVEFFRAVPLVLLILFSGLALPKYGVRVSLFWFVVFGLVAYNSAVLAEIFRAGILSLERGQSEAASAIGLTYWQSMGLVILPQALRRMVPAIVAQLVTLLKDTSLGFVLGLQELLRRGQQMGEFFRNPLQSLVVVALIYLVVNFVLSRLARRLEARQRRRYHAAPIAVAGVEELSGADTEAPAKQT